MSSSKSLLYASSVDAWMAGVQEGPVMLDLVGWGVISLKGEDRLNFLHNQVGWVYMLLLAVFTAYLIIIIISRWLVLFCHLQLTNKFREVASNSVLEASYTSPTGRTQDLVTAIVLGG